MNLNVGEMPFEIFCDYISDNLGINFPFEYLVPIMYGFHPMTLVNPIHLGNGIGYRYDPFIRDYYGYNRLDLAWGCGYSMRQNNDGNGSYVVF